MSGLIFISVSEFVGNKKPIAIRLGPVAGGPI